MTSSSGRRPSLPNKSAASDGLFTHSSPRLLNQRNISKKSSETTASLSVTQYLE
jgi:hypothetical protein